MQLLWATDDKIKAEGEKSKREAKSDLILSTCGKLIIPFVLVFGVCILFNGHISPGGGFSGGSVLGASVILFAVTYGSKATSRFFTKTVFNIIRISGLMIYAIMFGVYIYQGANGIESDLAHYIVLVIDLAVGLVVMSTMYGFYSFYTKGDL
jgi:multicomponent Na+:H+ antiporter subunit B